MMDEGKIALSVGVELSFLTENQQREVLENCELNDCTPSYSQANHIHKDFIEGVLSDESITEIMVNGTNDIYIEIDGKLIKDDSISFINNEYSRRAPDRHHLVP